MSQEGVKNDKGKARFDLIPPLPLIALAELYEIGSRKYADRNMEQGLKFGRVFAAMMRHVWAWWAGEKNDKEGGQHHLSSVSWCAFTLMEMERVHPECDDRPEYAKPLSAQDCIIGIDFSKDCINEITIKGLEEFLSSLEISAKTKLAGNPNNNLNKHRWEGFLEAIDYIREFLNKPPESPKAPEVVRYAEGKDFTEGHA